MKFSAKLVALATTAMVEAAIVEDGPWTGKDWYDESLQIGVANGVPYSNDPAVQHMLTAPLTVDGSIDDTYLESSNVQTIQAVLNEDDWAVGFPIADPAYSYDNFLRAAAKFPSFCNETNIED